MLLVPDSPIRRPPSADAAPGDSPKLKARGAASSSAEGSSRALDPATVSVVFTSGLASLSVAFASYRLHEEWYVRM